MEKERFAGHGGGGGGLPPPFGGRLPSFPSPSPVKLEISPPPGSSSGQPEFSNDLDLSAMLDFPPRNRGHRRAHSEILGLPDDISFDSDLGIVGGPGEGPSLSDEADDDLLSMYMDMEQFGEPSPSPANERPRVRHQHSQSMDGSTSVKAELLSGAGSEGPSVVDAKKAMSAAKLSELALIDPKRAKRYKQFCFVFNTTLLMLTK